MHPGRNNCYASRTPPDPQRALRFLARLTGARRATRLAAGAVELESAELRFRTDAQGQPVEVDVKQVGRGGSSFLEEDCLPLPLARSAGRRAPCFLQKVAWRGSADCC